MVGIAPVHLGRGDAKRDRKRCRMPKTDDFISPFFTESENPKSEFRTGAISTAAALLYCRIPLLRVEGTTDSVIFVFDNTDQEADRIEHEHTSGKLMVISSMFVRCNFRVRDAMGEFRRKTTRRIET